MKLEYITDNKFNKTTKFKPEQKCILQNRIP